MRHDNLHYTLPNGDTFSMTAIDGRYEVAVLRTSSPDFSFVPVLEWLGSDHDNGEMSTLPATMQKSSLKYSGLLSGGRSGIKHAYWRLPLTKQYPDPCG